ncbi:hypothetical protein ACPPVU_10135 [Mucilaginibacter sp. McL0603]|uniref:hypothetical protein n=1 Tax=Mucilaginibacter sp. McL0603 TaxID=3415670 RepID=UPI003CF6AA34
MRKIILVLTLLLLIAILNGFGQTNPAGEMQKNYTLYNRSMSPGEESGSVHLDARTGEGIAWIKDKKFKQGTIEFDVKGKDAFMASFVGIAFHGVNEAIYEAVYFRPFNFQSTDLTRVMHGVQYIASPKFDWPVLRSTFPGKYEQPISPAPDPNSWLHVRITVESKNIKVYVNDGTSPVLNVEPLVETKGDMIGYWVGGDSAGDWKNFKITPLK